MNKGLLLFVLFDLLLLHEAHIALAAEQPPAPDTRKAPSESAGLEQAILNGKARMDKGDLDGALDSFNSIIKIAPENAEVVYYIGVIYMRKNQPNDGVEYIKKSAMLAPGNMKVRVSLALAYEQLNRLDEAMKEYKFIMSKSAGTEEARSAEKSLYLIQIRQYAEAGDVDAALALAAILRRDYADDPRILHAVGLAFFNFNHLDDAEGVFKQVANLLPGSATPHFYLARVYERSGKIPLAIEQLKRAIKLEPGSDVGRRATVRLGLIKGVQLLEKKDLQGGLKEFQGVLAIDPNELMALFNIGTIYRELKQPDEAVATFKKLLEIEPRHLEARLRLGVIYMEANQFVESSRELEAVVSMGANTPFGQQAAAILRNMQETFGVKLTEARKLADELEGYKKALVANPNDFAAHFNLGVLYARQMLREEALREFEHAVRINPDHAKAHYYVGLIQDDKGLYEKAVASYSKAVMLETEPVEAERVREKLQLAVARDLYAKDKIDLAKRHFDDLLQKNPRGSIALFYTGLIQSRKGELDEAERTYQQIISLNPDNLGARGNLALLYENSNREEDALKEYRFIAQNGGTSPLVDTAEKKILGIERKINGFTYNMSSSLAYDNNSNLSKAAPFYEYISNISLNMIYRYKLSRNLRSGLTVNPAYMIYHFSQSDFTRIDISPFVTWGGGDRSVTLGGTRSDISGLLNEQRVSLGNHLYSDAIWRFTMPSVLGRFAAAGEQKSAPSMARLNLSYRDFASLASSFFNSVTYSLGLSFNQSLGLGRSFLVSYDYSDNRNTREEGRDYAFRGHSATLRFDKSLSAKMSANATYNLAFNFYSNPDSVTNFQQRRTNVFNSLSLSLNYEINDKLRVFASYSFQHNNSNLPVGFILNATELIGVQSRALGDYSKSLLSAGLTLSF
ncbi:MAG: tetratricopeptide repeat protein [Gammaproteobacteria bacterium]|nr:tetratricopeptide repeat protein [Gammaproteobacteria bacterium]